MTLLEHFKKICSIPHPSGNEKELADYVEDFARKRSLEVYRDKNNNLIITLPSKNSDKTVMLQAHTDMVFVADDNTEELIKRPLELIEKDGYLSAKGTSLGADDGTGMAIMLKLMEERPDPCPELQLIFTTEEETGLYGAKALDKSLLRSDMLINLDIDDEGIAIIGSAGGRRIELTKPKDKCLTKQKAFKVKIDGLKGGHSGAEIHLDRYNSLKLMIELIKNVQAELCSISGGSLENVIPSSCEATVICDEAKLRLEADKLIKNNTIESFSVTVSEAVTDEKLSDRSLIELIAALPCGVLEWEADKSCVRTSANVAKADTDTNELKLLMSVRSSSDSEKEVLCERIKNIANDFGFSYKDGADYCGWAPKFGTDLQKAYIKAYESYVGSSPVLEPVHAGLECSIIGQGRKNFDAISIGPNTKNIHSTKEALEIASLERTYDVVKLMLGELK
ncbi:MAG: aminoacyl-histidine dipeptidase [Ruminococcaceae bacterium]|nr:aminoacyl-histidine dipeptidase [Oscillospiraceae bacterium]